MTLIIGIQTNDGIIMGADSMSTEGAPVSGQGVVRHEADKLVLQGQFLWGASGQVGIKQLVQESIERDLKKIYSPHRTPGEVRHDLQKCIYPVLTAQYEMNRKCMESAFGRMPPELVGFTGFLFATYLVKSGFHLFNIEPDGKGEVVIARHAAIGSGQKTGQALLRRLRKQEWTLPLAEVVAYRTLSDAIHVEPSGIGEPIRLARCVCKDGKAHVELITSPEMEQIRDSALLWTDLEGKALSELHQQIGSSQSHD